jgi:hypothetical protein
MAVLRNNIAEAARRATWARMGPTTRECTLKAPPSAALDPPAANTSRICDEHFSIYVKRCDAAKNWG